MSCPLGEHVQGAGGALHPPEAQPGGPHPHHQVQYRDVAGSSSALNYLHLCSSDQLKYNRGYIVTPHPTTIAYLISEWP